MKRKLAFIVCIFITNSLIGCGTLAPKLTLPSPKSSNRLVVEKNYEIGKVHFANVGNPIIKLKDYVSTTTESGAMQASEDVSIQYQKSKWIRIKQGEPIPVAGTYEKKPGRKFTALQISKIWHVYFDTTESVQVLMKPIMININEAGKLTNSVFKQNSDGSLWQYHIDSARDYDMEINSKIVFTPAVSTAVLSPGSQNYELLYSGRSDKFINLQYREYTTDDLARPAFQQMLIYDANLSTFRFKNHQFKLISATNDMIEFTVLSE